MDRQQILQVLQEVIHPGRGSRNIVDLGMVHEVKCDDAHIEVVLGFPKRRDPLTEYLVGATRAALIRAFPGMNTEVKAIVVEEAAAKKKPQELDDAQLKQVKHIIGIASGKGGVGKSTVAVNLAIALSRLGYKVGLADADVYGPSVPTMTGTKDIQPDAVEENGQTLILPIEKYGVKWMSIGYFASEGQALIWRGPMACNALKQMILQVKWGELDFLLIDMPPGTGDIHITLVGDIPMESAIIVTTPQKVALADVLKGINMFQNENVHRRILGLVENMSWFTPAQHPDEKYYLFGRDGGVNMARECGLDLLQQIPLVQSVMQRADSGEPIALSDGPDAEAFKELAEKVAKLA